MARHQGWHRNDIENPAAYEAAVQARIKANANKTRRAKFEAAEPELYAWLNWSGEPIWNEATATEAAGAYCVGYTKHPAGPAPSFALDAFAEWGAPHPKAIPTLKKIYAERLERAAKREEQLAAERASAQAWQAGRQVVEGTIISTKVQEGFGYYGVDTAKMLVKRDDASKIFCTIPTSLPGTLEELRGKRIRFTVTVEPKQDEPTFAFGKRPAKATIIAQEAL